MSSTSAGAAVALWVALLLAGSARGAPSLEASNAPVTSGLRAPQFLRLEATPPGAAPGSGPRGRPPLSPGRLLGEVVASGASALVCGVALGIVGSQTIDTDNAEDPGVIGAIFGFIGGVTLGSSLGVQWVGSLGDESGSYLATLLGSAAGMALFLATDPDPDYASFWVGVFGLPTAGAMLGFNLTRHYDAPEPGGLALINLTEGRATLGLPLPFVRPAPSGRHTALHIAVAEGRF